MRRQRATRWLEICSDAAEIADVRRQFAEKMKERCQELLEHPERFRYDTTKVAHLARQYPEVLLPGWRALTQSLQQPFGCRIAAARFLCDQKDDAGLDFLLATLREGIATERGQALSEITSLQQFEGRWLARRAEELHPLLLCQLDPRQGAEHLNLIPQVAWACKKLDLQGAAEPASRLWEKDLSPWVRRAVAELLPPNAKTVAALRPLAATLEQPGLSEFDLSESLQGVTQFLNSPNAEVVQESLNLLQQHFPWERDELTREGTGADSRWYPIIEEAGRRGGRAVIPLLEHFLRSRLNAAYRGFALRALAKVLGKEALPLIEERLRDPAIEPWAVEALGVAFKGTADANQVARLRALAAHAPNEQVVERIADALAAIGGSAAKAAAESDVPADKLSPWQRAEMEAFTHGTTLIQAWTSLVKLGVVPAFSEDDVRQLQERENRKTHDWSLAILGNTGLLTWFDTETGEVPCPHDVLVRDFAEGSRGLFQPEAVLQEDGEDDEADCMVQFLFRDRLYRFRARNFGDYYDVEHTLAAINRALQEAGLSERFVEMATGDQTACFLFGNPGRLLQAAQEFKWPLADNSKRDGGGDS